MQRDDGNRNKRASQLKPGGVGDGGSQVPANGEEPGRNRRAGIRRGGDVTGDVDWN